jgi:RNA methyltransferase, TrmH family
MSWLTAAFDMMFDMIKAAGTPAVTHITSRDNPLLKELRKLSDDGTAYRKLGRVWLEGDHLCRAALQRGWVPAVGVFTEAHWPSAPRELAQAAVKSFVIADPLFAVLSSLESPAKMGFLIDLPPPAPVQPRVSTLILDRVQDAGNVGSILRSAAAFGVQQVLALKGTAALWSSKALRAGMGAHFALKLHEGVALDDLLADLDRLSVPLVVTSSHQGQLLHQQTLPRPCAWVMGHEGQGVCDALMHRAALAVRIGQPGGEESLNVAAAAAICLHASAVGAPVASEA